MEERKIGEIFEYNSDWYQCVKGLGCNECDLSIPSCYHCFTSGSCSPNMRKDETQVIFKKLEKVGEPYSFQGRTFQTYKLYIPLISEDSELVAIPSTDNNTIEIEIE